MTMKKLFLRQWVEHSTLRSKIANILIHKPSILTMSVWVGKMLLTIQNSFPGSLINTLRFLFLVNSICEGISVLKPYSFLCIRDIKKTKPWVYECELLWFMKFGETVKRFFKFHESQHKQAWRFSSFTSLSKVSKLSKITKRD